MSSKSILGKLRSLTKESLIYGLAHILTRSVTFLLLPYYSYRLSAADYGELSLYYLFLAVAQTFYVYGLDIAYLRFYNLKDHGRTSAQVNGTALLAVALSSSVLCLLGLLFRDSLGSLLIQNPENADDVPIGIVICLGILFFDTIGTFPFLRLRSENKPLSFSAQKIVNVVLNISLNVWMVGSLGLGVLGVLYANLIASFVTCALILPAFLRTCRFRIDRVLFSDLLAFGLPNIPTYLFVMVVELADRKVLELFRGIEEAGLYSSGYKLGMFMGVVNAAFRFAWQPFFLKHANDPQAPRLYARTLTYYVAVASGLLLMLTLAVPPLLKFNFPIVGYLISPSYWSGLVVFPIILAAHIFDGIYANLMVGIYLQKATRKLPFVTGVAAVFTVIANLLLVPTYGMLAAAWVTFFAFVIQALLLYLVVQRIYPIAYEWRRLAILAVITIALTGAAALFELNWSLRILLAVAFPVLLVFLRFFTSDEVAVVRRFVQR